MSNLRVLDPAFTDPFDGKVQARYADRVLTLELPKKASAAAKQITVQ
jgi:HSP20 family molecular chaperone IbpA